MAITDAYATAAEYRSRVQKSDSGDDTAILADLKAASRFIESRTGLFFNKDASVVTRVVEPDSAGPSLAVPPIASTEGIEILVDLYRTGSFAGLTPLTTDQYQLRPLNAAVGPEPGPYTEIFIPSWSSAYLWSPTAPVQVTAIWGWPTVPDGIKRVCIELAAIIRLESPRATSRVDTFGNLLNTSARARDIIDDLMLAYSPTAGIGIG